jgi:cellulose 1,4-beta-cellobiosidase
MDQNWRWLHKVGGYDNCFDHGWKCLGADCATSCAIEGEEYEKTAGVTAIEGGLKLAYVTKGGVGSRLYLLDGEEYYMMTFVNKEISITYDVSKLPCGVNGALYTVEMDKTGDLGGNNKAGAKYGTGYCDGQCPRDLKFVQGKANNEDYNASTDSGSIGYCCAEMDLWEANSVATALTGHPAAKLGRVICEEAECGNQGDKRYTGQTDRDGCQLQSFKNGKHDFYGPGKKVDTRQPFTVTTQFISSDKTDTGDLVEIKQFFTQNGNVIPMTTFDGLPGNSITDEYCTAAAEHFNASVDMFSKLGGLKTLGESLKRGHVFVMSIWDDAHSKMNWLDSIDRGIECGPCDSQAGDPATLRPQGKGVFVKYTDVKYGSIGSTTGPPSPTPPSPTPPSPPPPAPPSPPSPPTPPSPSVGKCCHGTPGASCGSMTTCQEGWCGQSQAHCESSCNGKWCPKLSEVIV